METTMGIITDILFDMVVMAIPTTCDDLAITTNIIINSIPIIMEKGSQSFFMSGKMFTSVLVNKIPRMVAVI
jgi:hypothetical protein